MNRIEQTKLHDPPDTNGNCLRATVASILEVEIGDLPAWEEMPKTMWWYAYIVGLRVMGWTVLQWAEPPDPDDYDGPDVWLASAKSPRHEGVNHAVVWGPDGLVWDPYPDGDGFEGEPESFEWFVRTPLQFSEDIRDGYEFGSDTAELYNATPSM